MTNLTSVVDIPRNASHDESDDFRIEPFERGLTRFLRQTATPITVALQGEWGSGKTSLMNSLRKELCESDGASYSAIWLNTWEYALMKDAESTLIDIIRSLVELTSDIAKPDDSTRNQMMRKVLRVGSNVAKLAAKTALNKVDVDFDEVQRIYSQNKEDTVASIREDLQKVISDYHSKFGKKFIFFIDDLDRIDPPVAVELLELLKNLFTLEHCVFVLAIDYDVVIKGLEPKFGVATASNEREFRSFFDKIIQVPFSMPVNAYHIDSFLVNSLLGIGYLQPEDASNENLKQTLSGFASLTVGTNPRSLKRLINSLSLISCINIENESSEDGNTLKSELDKLLNFALVSIQIAYPKIYRALVTQPDFTSWDGSLLPQFNIKPLSDVEKAQLGNMEEFDDEWEQTLLAICESDHFLKKKALNISRLLNQIDTISTANDESSGDMVESIISLSSVTNVDSGPTQLKNVEYHRGNLLKRLRSNWVEVISKELKPHGARLQNQSNRVQSNLFLLLTSDKSKTGLRFSSKPRDGEIQLSGTFTVRLNKASGNAQKTWQSADVWNQIEHLAEKWTELGKANSTIDTSNPLNRVAKVHGDHALLLNFRLSGTDPAILLSEQNREAVSAFIIESLPILDEFTLIKEKLKS